MAQPKIDTAQMDLTTVVIPHDITVGGLQGLADGDKFAVLVAPRDFSILASGHGGYANTPPSGADATITVSVNGSSIGTMTFTDGSPTLSSETVPATGITAGDRIEFELTTASGMEYFGVTLAATVTGVV